MPRLKLTRQALLLSAVLVAVAILAILFLVRPHEPPTKASVLSSVNAAYAQSYSPIDSYLHDHGLTLAPNPTQHPNDKQGGCVQDFVAEEERAHIHPSTTCLKMDSIRPIKFDDTFRAQWIKAAPALERYLQSQGWHKKYADQTAVADLFNHPKDNASFLNYLKSYGKVGCTITFDYNPPYPNPQDQMWIGEDCRQVL